MKIVQVHP